jgi:hypothetical protein
VTFYSLTLKLLALFSKIADIVLISCIYPPAIGKKSIVLLLLSLLEVLASSLPDELVFENRDQLSL